MKGDLIQVQIDNGNPFMVREDNASFCKHCGADILWCVTGKGKNMPVDPPVGEALAGESPVITTSHFQTCSAREPR